MVCTPVPRGSQCYCTRCCLPAPLPLQTLQAACKHSLCLIGICPRTSHRAEWILVILCCIPIHSEHRLNSLTEGAGLSLSSHSFHFSTTLRWCVDEVTKLMVRGETLEACVPPVRVGSLIPHVSCYRGHADICSRLNVTQTECPYRHCQLPQLTLPLSARLFTLASHGPRVGNFSPDSLFPPCQGSIRKISAVFPTVVVSEFAPSIWRTRAIQASFSPGTRGETRPDPPQ